MTERLLRIEAPHFVAGAVWQRRPDGWVCTEAAPIIKYLVGRSPEWCAAWRTRMEAKGWRFTWLKDSRSEGGT